MEKMKKEIVEKFFDAILSLETKEECAKFFDDVCTKTELASISQRLEVANLLEQKLTFNEITEKTGASATTISRVNSCLKYGDGGYETVLKRIK